MKPIPYSKIKEYLGLDQSSSQRKGSRRNGKGRKKVAGKHGVPRKTALKIVFIAGGFLGVIIIVGLIGFGVMVFAYSKELPPPGKPFSKNITQDTNIYDRNGTLLTSIHGDIDRKWVSLNDISPKMRWAMLSAEDVNFYQEPGVDVVGILRASVFDVLMHGQSLQGASTITQQLVKLAILDDQSRTVQRKIKEIILTLQVEKQYTKDQILEAYLNQIPFGGPTSGIRVASERYFNVEPSQLTLAQSAFLAGLPQAPSYYSPIYSSNPDAQAAATERANYVLNEMLKHKNLTGVTAAQIDEAKKELKTFTFSRNSGNISDKAPGFVQYVQSQLEQMYGADRVLTGGLQVTTSIDYNLQQVAEDEINREYCELNSGKDTTFRTYENGNVNTYSADICQNLSAKWPLRYFNGDDAGMVSIDPKTGEILAMVGSPKGGTQVNMMTAPGGVQPGSSIKPMLYLSAFKNLGMSPTTFMPDIPIQITSYNGYTFNPPYAPVNFGGAIHGVYDGAPINIDYDLSWSLNIPAVQTLFSLGMKNFVDDLKTLGYSNISEPENSSKLSYAIGGENVVFLDHVNAYGVLANQGTLYPATSILKVTDASGNVLYQYDPKTAGKKVIDDAYPYMVNKMLEHYKYLMSVGHAYNPGLFKAGYDIAGKTGTNNTATGTQNASSISFVGYTPDLVSGFWFGNQQQGMAMGNARIIPEGEYLIPYWGDYMEKVLPKFAKDSFQRPADIADAQVCQDTGLLYQAGKTQCSPVTAIFQKDHLPKVDDEHQEVQVCNSDPTKLATPAMVSAGDYQNRTIVTYKTYDSAFQSMLDSYLKNSNQIPTTYCTSEQGVLVGINSPSDGAQYSAGNQVSVAATIVSTTGGSITGGDILFNNQKVGSVSSSGGNSYSGTFTIPSSTSNGTYSLSVQATDSNGAQGNASININVGSGGGGGNTSQDVTINSPTSGQIILPAPSITSLRFTLNNHDPNHVTSAYFNVYSGGSLLNSSPINASRIGNSSQWSASYAFPVETSGYKIVATVVVDGQTISNYVIASSP